ncbi:MAG: serine/threonine-protein kinase [Cyanobacteria bacterium P01_A01_bin.84]
MEVYCTRPGCPRPQNHFADLDDRDTLVSVQQKYCTACGMPLILAGRYLPINLLGRGGFGAAFLASDRYTPLMRQCVVKQFLPAGNLSPTQLQLAQDLFEREAVVLEEIGSLNDQIPNLFAYFPLLVADLKSGEKNQYFYLVQEYIEGLNLEDELTQKGKLGEAEVFFVLEEILQVLQFVHQKGIIHRDIKPSNIMRHRNGRIYLLDFGAVKQVTNNPIGSTVSSTGIYSLGFAPPEQMSGGEVFPSTDLYAFAVTCVMLLTGEKEVTRLFDAYSNQLKWRDRVQVSQILADVIDKMLVPAANKRFSSAIEVLQALAPLKTEYSPTPQQTSLPASTNPQPQIEQSRPIPSTQIVAPFSTFEILTGAAFSGFEGCLIAIAIFGLSNSSVITLAITAPLLGGLILSQSKRWIEKSDLLIIPAITFAIIFFVPLLQGGLGIKSVIILSFGTSLATIALTSLFRLIYKLLSLLL